MKKGYRRSHNISHIVLEIIKGEGVSNTFPGKHESSMKLQAHPVPQTGYQIPLCTKCLF